MILTIIQIILAILLIVSVLLQSQGAGLSSSFGGSGEFYRSRRSLEKFLVWITAGLCLLFGIVSLALLFPH